MGLTGRWDSKAKSLSKWKTQLCPAPTLLHCSMQPCQCPFLLKKPPNFNFPYSAVDLHFTVILKDNQVPNKSSPSTQAVVDVEQTLLRSWILSGSLKVVPLQLLKLIYN